jgi:hypothetical protein
VQRTAIPKNLMDAEGKQAAFCVRLQMTNNKWQQKAAKLITILSWICTLAK